MEAIMDLIERVDVAHYFMKMDYRLLKQTRPDYGCDSFFSIGITGFDMSQT